MDENHLKICPSFWSSQEGGGKGLGKVKASNFCSNLALTLHSMMRRRWQYFPHFSLQTTIQAFHLRIYFRAVRRRGVGLEGDWECLVTGVWCSGARGTGGPFAEKAKGPLRAQNWGSGPAALLGRAARAGGGRAGGPPGAQNSNRSDLDDDYLFIIWWFVTGGRAEQLSISRWEGSCSEAWCCSRIPGSIIVINTIQLQDTR